MSKAVKKILPVAVPHMKAEKAKKEAAKNPAPVTPAPAAAPVAATPAAEEKPRLSAREQKETRLGRYSTVLTDAEEGDEPIYSTGRKKTLLGG